MMKIQLFSLLIIITLTNCTGIRFSSIDDGACASNTKYTFKITGQSDEAVSANIKTTITFATPVSPTYTCTNEAIAEGEAADNTEFVLNCEITSEISNTAIKITGIVLGDGGSAITATFVVGGNTADSISTEAVTCPVPKNSFTVTGKTDGSCANNEYSFTVTGTVTNATTSVTTWTPTFSAPTNPTATCSMPAATIEANNAVITCKITSALSNSAITLTKLVADGFNDVTIASGNQAIATGKTCAGTTTTNPSNPSNDGSKFISLNAMLFLFFLLIF